MKIMKIIEFMRIWGRFYIHIGISNEIFYIPSLDARDYTFFYIGFRRNDGISFPVFVISFFYISINLAFSDDLLGMQASDGDEF